MGSSAQTPSFLRVSGTDIVDEHGSRVILKGAALAGFLNMENFITGYSGHEHQHRASMTAVLGKEKADYFFDRLIHYFFTEEDAQYYASTGLNCVRVPFNYRHFIDDQNPHVIKQSGFKRLDRIVEICRKFNLYVILDLHAAPGGQNQDWHSDGGLSHASFWDFRLLQDQIIDLWVAIAKHYASDPLIAGYNPLNEPSDPQHIRLIQWYDRAHEAIRAVDPKHILFLDGNCYSMDFSHFDHILPNAVYSCHDYSNMGFPGQPQYTGTEAQKTKLRAQLDRKTTFMRDWNVPVWNGEFGPVYPDAAKDPDAPTTMTSRISLLHEQLDIYAAQNISWNIWLYKDIGYQGMVYLDPNSPYMKLIMPFVEKKQRLGVDFWGCTDKEGVRDVYGPFIEGLKKMIPADLLKKKYPPVWTFDRQVERAVRECLVSEYLVWEFAGLFEGKSMQELEELAASFAYKNCVKRDSLTKTLMEDASRS